jgi:uncharacterized protein with FMN-binding domain
MRRAILATAATGIGLVALLGYKSGGAVSRSTVTVGGSSPVATPAAPTTAPATTGPSSAGPTSYTGTDVQYNYGDLEVRITVAGGRITAITVPEDSARDPRSESINSQAIPILTQEALAAQGLHFDVVSGATFTSDAFAQSLQSALTQTDK